MKGHKKPRTIFTKHLQAVFPDHQLSFANPGTHLTLFRKPTVCFPIKKIPKYCLMKHTKNPSHAMGTHFRILLTCFSTQACFDVIAGERNFEGFTD